MSGFIWKPPREFYLIFDRGTGDVWGPDGWVALDEGHQLCPIMAYALNEYHDALSQLLDLVGGRRDPVIGRYSLSP